MVEKVQGRADRLIGWEAKSKAHEYPCPATLEVFAIGIKPSSGKMPFWEVNCFTKTSSCSQFPEVIFGHKDMAMGDYVMVGGGAPDETASGGGNLLFVSAPVADSATGRLIAWTARGKDHGHVSPASITCYAYGIAKSKLDDYMPIIKVHAHRSAPSIKPSVGVFAQNTIGGGAKVELLGDGPGNLLTASYPDTIAGGWTAQSKDHQYPCTAYLTAYALSFDITYLDDAN